MVLEAISGHSCKYMQQPSNFLALNLLHKPYSAQSIKPKVLLLVHGKGIVTEVGTRLRGPWYHCVLQCCNYQTRAHVCTLDVTSLVPATLLGTQY